MLALIEKVKLDLSNKKRFNSFADYYADQQTTFTPHLYFLALLHEVDDSTARQSSKRTRNFLSNFERLMRSLESPEH